MIVIVISYMSLSFEQTTLWVRLEQSLVQSYDCTVTMSTRVIPIWLRQRPTVIFHNLETNQEKGPM